MPEAHVTRRNLILVLAATTALSALALSAARARDIPKVATGFVANILCSETFVSGQQPERIFAETTAAMPGVSLITWGMGYKVDRTRRDVTVTLFGFGKSHAVYRERLGCYLDHGDGVATPRCRPPRSSRCRCCCRILPVQLWLRRQARNSRPRSIAPSPSLNSLRSVTPRRWWS
jgi:hypothetical protein